MLSIKAQHLATRTAVRPPPRPRRPTRLFSTDPDAPSSSSPDTKNLDSVAEKYGLEVGLWKAFNTKNADGKTKMTSAKELLTKYGSAYLITSITLSLISFGLCYVLIDHGVDVASILAKIGVSVTGTSEKVGTAALAYAAHKAASPIRFPPTVALTPLVARFLGKKEE